MTIIQKKVITMGIQIKLSRGEELEDILATYVNLSEDEKIQIRTSLE